MQSWNICSQANPPLKKYCTCTAWDLSNTEANTVCEVPEKNVSADLLVKSSIFVYLLYQKGGNGEHFICVFLMKKISCENITDLHNF